MAEGYIAVHEGLCKGCALCVTVCPNDLIKMSASRFTPKGYRPAELHDPEEACTGCAICATICPEAAISVYRAVKVA